MQNNISLCRLHYYLAFSTAKIVDLPIQKAYQTFFLAFLRKKTSKMFFIKKKAVPLQRNWAMV